MKQSVAPESLPPNVYLKELLRQPQDVEKIPLVTEVIDLLNVASVLYLERLDQVKVILSEFSLLDMKIMGADTRRTQPGTEEVQVIGRGDAEEVIMPAGFTAADEIVNLKRCNQGNVAGNI